MAIHGWGTEDLDTLKTPGHYAQHANANTSAERHYPENNAGGLIVTSGAGVQQRYHVYNTSRVYIRAQYDVGGWSPWIRMYTTEGGQINGSLNATGSLYAAGNVSSGTNVSAPTLSSTGNTNVGGNLLVTGTISSTGAITSSGNITAYSDRSLKKDIIDLDSSLETVMKLRPVKYVMKADKLEKVQVGFIAQEVQEVIPEVVVEHDDGLLSMDYSRITAHLVKAMQEQQRLIEELRSEIEQLKRK